MVSRQESQQQSEAEAIFKKIFQAYQVLSDPEKRKVYDQYGEEGLIDGLSREPRQVQPSKCRGHIWRVHWFLGMEMGSRTTTCGMYAAL
ncbi:dnaJ subfamily B member 1-like isoform X2 [Salvia divinorum]|uniref:DnaJ subfamily B member 1-like isoform X2 n=1 Tax=Salvia divinorum TaxID=28513 RepID=A0ABD1I3P7_SALDI